MSDDRQSESVLGELADELKLQAWLARRETSEPSLKGDGVHKEASALARMRDTLRVQLHLGQLDAKDEWEKLENSWRSFMRNDLARAANEVATGAGELTHQVLEEIRDSYQKLLVR